MADRETIKTAQALYARLDRECAFRQVAESYYGKVTMTADNAANRVETIGIDKDVALQHINAMIAVTEAELRNIGFDPNAKAGA